jgi:hypothetical protein
MTQHCCHRQSVRRYLLVAFDAAVASPPREPRSGSQLELDEVVRAIAIGVKPDMAHDGVEPIGGLVRQDTRCRGATFTLAVAGADQIRSEPQWGSGPRPQSIKQW